MPIYVLEFASMHVHVCIHRSMLARMSPYGIEMLLHLNVCMCTSKHSCESLCTELFDCLCVCKTCVWQCVYLAFDDVIILVDLQDVSGVAGDGAAVSIVEVAARATALELCIAD